MKRIAVIPKLNYANDWRAWSGGLGNATTYFEGFKTSFDYVYQEALRGRPGAMDVIVHAEQAVGTHDYILALAKEIVYTHHERWDGTGYHEGLRGTEIPIPGRLMAVVDTYDALRSRRVYQPAIPHPEAVRIIVDGRGTHFDPAVVDAFLAVAPQLEQVSNAA